MSKRDDKLIETGRKLKKEIDDAYDGLRTHLQVLGDIKRGILAKESALRSVQERLLHSEGMGVPSGEVAAKRRRAITATDDDDLPW